VNTQQYHSRDKYSILLQISENNKRLTATLLIGMMETTHTGTPAPIKTKLEFDIAAYFRFAM
jgi:hypothetical protein